MCRNLKNILIALSIEDYENINRSFKWVQDQLGLKYIKLIHYRSEMDGIQERISQGTEVRYFDFLNSTHGVIRTLTSVSKPL